MTDAEKQQLLIVYGAVRAAQAAADTARAHMVMLADQDQIRDQLDTIVEAARVIARDIARKVGV